MPARAPACSGDWRRSSQAIRAGAPRAASRRQLSDILFHGGSRGDDQPPAKGLREPDRARLIFKIDMNLQAGAVAAMAKPVRLDPPMVEPGPHLRHRIDQPVVAYANFDNVL